MPVLISVAHLIWMDRNPRWQKTRNECLFFSLMFENQSITDLVFLHWLEFVLDLIVLLILSNMYVYIYIYKLVTGISFSHPHRKQYKLITNDDETPQIPFTPIFRPHSVIFFRVTNKPLTCYTFKLLNCQGNARA